MSYASPSQLLSRYDSRTIGELVSDDGIAVTEANLATNQKLLDALEDASGQIRSAALVGHKYTTDDLDTLAAANDPFLVRLTATLAVGFLLRRRPGLLQQLPPDVEQAEQWLAAIRFGERILNIDGNKAAGTLTSGFMSLAARKDLNLVADSNRFFPMRSKYGV